MRGHPGDHKGRLVLRRSNPRAGPHHDSTHVAGVWWTQQQDQPWQLLAGDAAGARGPAAVVQGLPFHVHLSKSSCSWSCSLYQRWGRGAHGSIMKPDIHKPSCAPQSWLQGGKRGVVQSGREGLQRKGTPELSISSQDHHNNSLRKMRSGVSCWLQGAIELSGCGHWLSLPVQGACQTIWKEHLLPLSPAAAAKGVQRRKQAKGCWAQQ